MFSNAKRRIAHGEKIEAAAPGTSVIKANGLTLKNLIGTPYSDVSLEIEQGQVFAIRGRNGSGKTALLLTLVGRMLFTKGTLEILGWSMPLHAGRVRRRVGLAFFEGLNDLSENQTVRNAVAAEFELWGRKAKRKDVAAYLKEWGLEQIADKRITDLNREQFVALGVQLAWVGHPDIIAVDDIESNLTKDQSTALMERLHRMARTRNVTILVGVLERDLAAMADEALYLEEGAAPRFVKSSADTQQGLGENGYKTISVLKGEHIASPDGVEAKGA
ncbi:MAG: ATP-binding cassette domain-containing protein [Eggerthellaceae bacterium]|nr:ATP-binding cassette domain-containing protein [Eggerthellaceae bacterium]